RPPASTKASRMRKLVGSSTVQPNTPPPSASLPRSSSAIGAVIPSRACLTGESDCFGTLPASLPVGPGDGPGTVTPGPVLEGGDLIYCTGTAMGRPFLEKVEAAAEAGFAGISILTSEYLRARDDGMSDADLLAAVRDAGLSIAEVSNYHGWLGSRGQPSEAEE